MSIIKATIKNSKGNSIQENAIVKAKHFNPLVDKVIELEGIGNLAPEDIKTSYESNADTNAFTDAEKTIVSKAITTDGTTFGNPITGNLQFDAAESKIYKNLLDEHQHYFVMSEAAEVIAMVHDAGTHTCIVGIQHSDNLIGIIKDDGVNPKGIIYNIDEDRVDVLLSDMKIADPTKGIILTSPDLTEWRITVDNDGNLTTTEI